MLAHLSFVRSGCAPNLDMGAPEWAEGGARDPYRWALSRSRDRMRIPTQYGQLPRPIMNRGRWETKASSLRPLRNSNLA